MTTGEPRHRGIFTVGTTGREESSGSARREFEILASRETACPSRLRLRSYILATRIMAASRSISAAATKSPTSPSATFGMDSGGTAGDIVGLGEICAEKLPVPYIIDADAMPYPGTTLPVEFMTATS